MDEKAIQKVKTDVESELLKCESKIKELKGSKAAAGEARAIADLETQLQGCRVALDVLLKKRSGEWETAKEDVLNRLSGLARNLDSTERRVARFK